MTQTSHQDGATVAYPKRPPFYAHKLTRVLLKTCAAQEMGQAATLLVIFVAHTEDAAHFRRAITFHDAQLMPVIGVGSWRALNRARQAAIKAGWLHFHAGGNRKPRVYWSLLPDTAAGLDDRASDEGGDGATCAEDNGAQVGAQVERQSKRRSSAGRTAAPPTLALPLAHNLPPSEDCTDLPSGNSVPAASATSNSKVVLTFPCSGTGAREWHLTEEKIAEYRESFPGIDVVLECKAARQWAVDNPRKRKTPCGMPAFLSRWLAKSQNENRGEIPSKPKSRVLTAEELKTWTPYGDDNGSHSRRNRNGPGQRYQREATGEF
ncbi:MAG: hypothetical protein ACT4QC_00645 [Planctomycetaceae bacterium]